MGLFGRRKRDWSAGPVEADPTWVRHSAPLPDLMQVARDAIALSGVDPEEVDLVAAVARTLEFVGGVGQSVFRGAFGNGEAADGLDAIAHRQDMTVEMMWAYFTHHGAQGMAVQQEVAKFFDSGQATRSLADGIAQGDCRLPVRTKRRDAVPLAAAQGGSRFIEAFPDTGWDVLTGHMLQLVKAAGLTFTLRGACSPQEIHDEWVRLVPLCEQSEIQPQGMGLIFGNPYLDWCILTDGSISMALYPGVPAHESENPRAKEVFDAFFDGLLQENLQAGFESEPLFNGEGSTAMVTWLEHEAKFVPLSWLTPWQRDGGTIHTR